MNSLSYSIFYDFVIKQLNNYYLFNEGIELWQIYNKFWIQFYFDFFNGYSEWAKWLFDVNIPNLNDVFGLVNIVQDVDVIDTSIAGDKQIAIILRHNAQGNSPDITVNAGAIKFQFQQFTKMFGDVTENIRKGNIFSNFNWLNQVNNDFSLPFAFKAGSKLSGTSKVKMGWTSPNTVNVNLFGESTLKDTNVIGIRIHTWYFPIYLKKALVYWVAHHGYWGYDPQYRIEGI